MDEINNSDSIQKVITEKLALHTKIINKINQLIELEEKYNSIINSKESTLKKLNDTHSCLQELISEYAKFSPFETKILSNFKIEVNEVITNIKANIKICLWKIKQKQYKLIILQGGIGGFLIGLSFALIYASNNLCQ